MKKENDATTHIKLEAEISNESNNKFRTVDNKEKLYVVNYFVYGVLLLIVAKRVNAKFRSLRVFEFFDSSLKLYEWFSNLSHR